MSEQPDAVLPLPGAPASAEGPITVEANWHNAPGTGAYEMPRVTPVAAYDVVEHGDGTTTAVAKVLQPPARPTRKAGRQAEAKVADTPPAVDEVQADAEPAQDPESS